MKKLIMTAAAGLVETAADGRHGHPQMVGLRSPENCGEVRDLATGKATVLTRNSVGNFICV